LLKSEHIFLRKLQLNDVDFIYDWENNPANWEVSNTKQSFSKEDIVDFVQSEQNIILNKQIRFVICLNLTEQPIGCIDLFEFDEQKKEVGIGILIADNLHRSKGYATESLRLLINYCSNELKIVHLFCNIFKENISSIRLFENCGFQFIEERILDGNKVNYYELKC
jgi:diamine N-acetyltransferase